MVGEEDGCVEEEGYGSVEENGVEGSMFRKGLSGVFETSGEDGLRVVVMVVMVVSPGVASVKRGIFPTLLQPFIFVSISPISTLSTWL